MCVCSEESAPLRSLRNSWYVTSFLPILRDQPEARQLLSDGWLCVRLEGEPTSDIEGVDSECIWAHVSFQSWKPTRPTMTFLECSHEGDATGRVELQSHLEVRAEYRFWSGLDRRLSWEASWYTIWASKKPIAKMTPLQVAAHPWPNREAPLVRIWPRPPAGARSAWGRPCPKGGPRPQPGQGARAQLPEPRPDVPAPLAAEGGQGRLERVEQEEAIIDNELSLVGLEGPDVGEGEEAHAVFAALMEAFPDLAEEDEPPTSDEREPPTASAPVPGGPEEPGAPSEHGSSYGYDSDTGSDDDAAPSGAPVPAAPGARVTAELRVEFPHGSITYYGTTSRFVAHCQCAGHGRKCFKTATALGRVGQKGRPLGLLYAWLLEAPAVEPATQKQHLDTTPTYASRVDARRALEGAPAAAPLFEEERKQRPGEGPEPLGV